ncbi:Uncharacterised protein [Klebsiella pneumoniae]|nr:Uncharacterised protein [Klebsiella pneumoniae]SYR78285.1 Uncharacterised protein [Klebsiella pneumoniae]
MENKSRAFDPHYFFPIHILFFNHIKVFAKYFFFVTN